MVATPYRPPRVGLGEEQGPADSNFCEIEQDLLPSARRAESSDLSHTITQKTLSVSAHTSTSAALPLNLDRWCDAIPKENIRKCGQLIKKASGHAGSWKERQVNPPFHVRLAPVEHPVALKHALNMGHLRGIS